MADSLVGQNPLIAMLPKPTGFQGFGYEQGGINETVKGQAQASLKTEEASLATSEAALKAAQDELARQKAELQKKVEEKNRLTSEKSSLESDKSSKQSRLQTLQNEVSTAQADLTAAKDAAAAREKETAARVTAYSPTPSYSAPYIPAPLPMAPFKNEIQRNVQISPAPVVPPPMGAATFGTASKPAPYAPPPTGAAVFYPTQAAKDKADREKAMSALGKALKGWF